MNCPYHNKPMRQNSRGWYCPTKLPDGTWCKYKPTANSSAEIVQSANPISTSPYRPVYEQKKTDWDKIGKMKALCGMVNAMLSFGAKPEDITAATILQLNRIVGLIETASGVPASAKSTAIGTTGIKAGIQANPTEQVPIEAYGEPLPNKNEYASEINIEDIEF